MLIHSRREAAMTGSDSHSTSAAPTPATWILRTRRRSSESQQTFNEIIRKLFRERVHGEEDYNGIFIINLKTPCFITIAVFSSLTLAGGGAEKGALSIFPPCIF
jgi:hypothetical protein